MANNRETHTDIHTTSHTIAHTRIFFKKKRTQQEHTRTHKTNTCKNTQHEQQ